MNDVDKVIQHFQDAIEASGNNNKWRFVRVDIIEDAIAMLKEQEAVSVAGPNSYEEYWDREAICPDCGTHWMSYGEDGKRVTKYCPGCGRPVKWK